MPSWLGGFFGMCEGMQIIFNMGFVPTDEELCELTPEQYRQFYDTVVTEEDRISKEKMYMIRPKDPKLCAKLDADKVLVFRETEVRAIKAGAKTIEEYCAHSKRKFKTFNDKLRYCASVMPGIFSEGTKYERYHDEKWASPPKTGGKRP